MRRDWIVLCLLLCACSAPPVVSDRDATSARDASTSDTSLSAPDAITRDDVATSAPDAIEQPDVIDDHPALTDAAPSLCAEAPACDAPAPTPDPRVSWNNLLSNTVVLQGAARHRGRDLYLRAGAAQWALAKFAYGLADSDLHGEDVDIYLLRDCRTWERLGRARTTNDGDHAPVLGVEDTGGRVYFEIPADRRLSVGWHRLRFVVRGDHTTTDQYIRVLPEGSRMIVTDMDGTLTESETAEFATLLTGVSPAANPGAADVMHALARRGYEIFYLTARPEWLATRSHEWIVERGFPQGIVHTTLGLTGATGAPAQQFKTAELDALRTETGVRPEYSFGNTDTDAAAFAGAGVSADHSLMYRFSAPAGTATRHDDYRTLLSRFEAIAPVCR